MTYFLAGDIGGTKALLQVFEAGDAHTPVLRKSYPGAGYAGLAEILEVFLRDAGVHDVAAACFALAGPVSGRKVKLTNLPWEVDADALAARFNLAQVALINDFEAVGLGVAALQSSDLFPLQQGEAQTHGVRIVVGAGTGLGVAWLAWHAGGYAVHPSEGGHADFAPTDELQYALLQYLQQRHGHVSYERIVSGPGLVAIYEFLRDSGRSAPSPALSAAMEAGDAAAAIAGFACGQGETIATQALDVFTQIYGAFVGNVALMALPRGGIYVAGGIAAKIVAQMQRGEFMRAFLDKGRFTGLLSTFPLSIVTTPQIGLLGASLVAQK
ncbi:MAG: glucokinase [Gallionellaceae bacterium]|nr:MAG: glucokinase [Gallionellaceae bacterium]